MHVTALTLKQFRCFDTHTITFDKPFVIIAGPNGSGKTSLLEALYYACYLRSFRTRSTRELIRFDEEAFSLKLRLEKKNNSGLGQPGVSSQEHDITVGYSHEKRIIKLDAVPLTSYKELLGVYRIIALTGDDTALIKGTPDCRRQFLDQAIMLDDTDYPALVRKYTGILAQRNALLNQFTVSRESYNLWTEQLLHTSHIIRERRRDMVKKLETCVNGFLNDYFDAPFRVGLAYKSKDSAFRLRSTSYDGQAALQTTADMSAKTQSVYSNYAADLGDLFNRERAAHYTLIGAHLDDCAITLAGRTSRQYASKGQQKLLALLLKIAQPGAHRQSPTLPACIFVLDDVVSDLDENRIERLFALLASYKSQIIMTSPLDHPVSNKIAATHDCQLIRMEQL